MLGVRPMRFKAVRIAARSSAALGGISLNAHSHATVLRSTSTKNLSGSSGRDELVRVVSGSGGGNSGRTEQACTLLQNPS